jgi:integrase
MDRARGVIRVETIKGGRPQARGAPNSNADAVLARRLTKDPKGYVSGSKKRDTFRTAWEATVKRAKLEDFRFHDLRHNAGSRIMPSAWPDAGIEGVPGIGSRHNQRLLRNARRRSSGQ